MNFSEDFVKALFLLAGIEVLKMWQLDNQYWPVSHEYAEIRKRSPWYLVKTKAGMVQIGWRKRVLSIDWTDTPVRRLVTQENITKDDCMVHAYSYAKAVLYLSVIAPEIDKYATQEAPT